MNNTFQKIKDILNVPQLGSLATISKDGKPWVRYIQISADQNLNLSFATCLSSRKIEHINKSSEVHITIGVQNMSELNNPYLQIQGRAVVNTTSEAKNTLWHDMLSNIYEGPDDPNYAVIIVTPYRIELCNINNPAPEVWINEKSMKSNKEYFNNIASSWDDMRQEFFPQKVREVALKEATLGKNNLAADIGAGTGFISEALLQHNINVIAIDQSEEMIKMMNSKFHSFNNFQAKLGSSSNIPIPDNTIDSTFANMYLHHVDSPSIAIQEMCRITKGGGKVIITDLDTHNYDFLQTEHFDKWLGFDREQIKKWFEEAGLENVKINCVDAKCSSSSQNTNNKANISIFIASGTKQ